jgi:hypothetical protein
MRRRFLVKLGGKIIKILKLAASLSSNITKNKMPANSSSYKTFLHMTSPEWSILRMDSQTSQAFNEELAGLFGRINKEYRIFVEAPDEEARRESARRLQELNREGFSLLNNYGVPPELFGKYLNTIRNPHKYFEDVFLKGKRPDELDWTERLK